MSYHHRPRGEAGSVLSALQSRPPLTDYRFALSAWCRIQAAAEGCVTPPLSRLFNGSPVRDSAFIVEERSGRSVLSRIAAPCRNTLFLLQSDLESGPDVGGPALQVPREWKPESEGTELQFEPVE